MVSLDAIAAAKAGYTGDLAFGWIALLLDPAYTSLDSNVWIPPSRKEIHLIVGRESLTGTTVVAAAALVGMSVKGFHKYLAQEGTKAHRVIGYATWHLLLHRLGVTKIPQGIS